MGNNFNLYKSTHIDRSMWTFNVKYSERWKEKGLKKSQELIMYDSPLFLLSLDDLSEYQKLLFLLHK